MQTERMEMKLNVGYKSSFNEYCIGFWNIVVVLYSNTQQNVIAQTWRLEGSGKIIMSIILYSNSLDRKLSCYNHLVVILRGL